MSKACRTFPVTMHYINVEFSFYKNLLDFTSKTYSVFLFVMLQVSSFQGYVLSARETGEL